MGSAPKPKPYVVPLFIPHAGCPHRCVFCDQNRTTGQSDGVPRTNQLHAEVSKYLGYRRDLSRPTEIAFYGGNFLGLPPERVVALLELGADYVNQGAVQGIRFSTRPDTITTETLELIADFPVTTIELGVQTLNDNALKVSRRGHSARDTYRAMTLLQAESYRIGLQMMVGLPGDTPEQALATGEAIARMMPDFVRIYPTLVLSGSPLARWTAQGRYTPMPLDDAVDLVKSLLRQFMRRKIKVIRMGLQPTADLNAGAGIVAGPFHPAFGELVHAALWRDSLDNYLKKLQLNGKAVEVAVHPTMLSRLKGCRNQNLKWVGDKFHLVRLCTRTIPDLPSDVMLLNGRMCELIATD